MEQSTTNTTTSYTPYAPLAALGLYLQQIDFFAPIRDQVLIMQKQVVHTPLQKLTDAFITILAGAHGLVEANTRVRSDAALQAAFGRETCAEQSTIQATLNACTDANVQQMTVALTTIYRQHSHGYRHNYQHRMQVLDVDLSGLPCGPKAALATKGYFANQRNRRGRQLGRVVATRYGEILTDQVFTGTTGLTKALRPLAEAAAQGSDPRQRLLAPASAHPWPECHGLDRRPTDCRTAGRLGHDPHVRVCAPSWPDCRALEARHGALGVCGGDLDTVVEGGD
jgi:hypothetical protein